MQNKSETIQLGISLGTISRQTYFRAGGRSSGPSGSNASGNVGNHGSGNSGGAGGLQNQFLHVDETSDNDSNQFIVFTE